MSDKLMLLSPSRLKDFVKRNSEGLRVGQDFIDTANALILSLSRRAIQKAQRIKRKTLRAEDLFQSDNMQKSLMKLILDHAQSSLESKQQSKELNLTEKAALELISGLKSTGTLF